MGLVIYGALSKLGMVLGSALVLSCCGIGMLAWWLIEKKYKRQ
jgi:hypothetical protein